MGTKLVKISNLPEDTLLLIFSFLPAQQLISRVTKVCSQWNALIQGKGCLQNKMTLVLEARLPFHKFEADLQRRLQFNEFSVDELYQARNIKSVKIYNYADHFAHGPNDNDILSHISQNCPGVEKIAIWNLPQLRRPSDSVLNITVSSFTELRVLELRGCGEPHLWSRTLLPRFDNREPLALIICSEWHNDDLKVIASGELQLQKLLIPFVCDIKNESWVKLLRAQRDSLEELSIAGLMISDVIYQALSQCTQLQELYVSVASDMRAAGLDAISQLPFLRKLTLQRATFPCQMLSNWLQTSPVLSNLRWLDLKHYTNWEPQLDQIVAKLVEVNRNLEFVR